LDGGAGVPTTENLALRRRTRRFFRKQKKNRRKPKANTADATPATAMPTMCPVVRPPFIVISEELATAFPVPVGVAAAELVTVANVDEGVRRSDVADIIGEGRIVGSIGVGITEDTGDDGVPDAITIVLICSVDVGTGILAGSEVVTTIEVVVGVTEAIDDGIADDVARIVAVIVPTVSGIASDILAQML